MPSNILKKLYKQAQEVCDLLKKDPTNFNYSLIWKYNDIMVKIDEENIKNGGESFFGLFWK